MGRVSVGNHAGSWVPALLHIVLLKRETLASDCHETANFRASLGQLGHVEPAAVAALPSSPVLDAYGGEEAKLQPKRCAGFGTQRSCAAWGIAVSDEPFSAPRKGSLEGSAFGRAGAVLSAGLTAPGCSPALLCPLKAVHPPVLPSRLWPVAEAAVVSLKSVMPRLPGKLYPKGWQRLVCTVPLTALPCVPRGRREEEGS